MRKGDLSLSEVLAWLDAYLTRPGDRVAFGLAPLADPAAISEAIHRAPGLTLPPVCQRLG
jgi:hypothetical protein